MNIVINEAKLAAQQGDNPYAALMLDPEGNIIETAHNRQISTKDRSAHAEVVLIREVSQKLNRLYLDGFSVVQNSEPCAMCMSLYVKSRLNAVYYGASQDSGNDPLIRAQEIVDRAVHKVELHGGILRKECEELISSMRHNPFS